MKTCEPVKRKSSELSLKINNLIEGIINGKMVIEQ
jgi:hypothetical protein